MVKPIHPELLRYCKQSITFGDVEFPKQQSTDTAVHFASILTTDSNPTAEDIDHGNRIRNTVIAADLDTFSFYDVTEKYKNCKFFLSVKGVSVLLIEYSMEIIVNCIVYIVTCILIML